MTKRKGAKFEFQDDRDRDLMRVYREEIEKSGYPIRLMDVLEKVVRHTSRAFWVSSQRAANIISRMRKGQPAGVKCRNKLKMFEELNRRVGEIETKNPSLTLSEMVDAALSTEAPSFYLTPKSAKVIIHRIRRRWKKSKQRYR